MPPEATMSDLDLAALLAFGAPQQKAIADSDPYLKAKIAPDLVGKVLLDNAANPNWSIKDKIVAGLLSGLGSGALQGLSTDYQGRAADAYRSVLSGGVTEKPSVLDADIFNAAKSQRDVFGLAAGLELAKESRALQAKEAFDKTQTQNDVAKTMLGSDDPKIRDMGMQLAAKNLGLDLSPAPRRDATAEMDKAEEASYATKKEELARKLGSDDKAEKVLQKEEEAARKSWFEALRPDEKQKARDAKPFVMDLYNLAEEFKGLSSNPLYFASAKKAKWTPEGFAYDKLLKRVMPVIKSGGAASNASDKEEARALEALLGNITAGGPDISKRITETADYILSLRVGNLKAGKTLKPKGEDEGADALLADLNDILERRVVATTPATPSATPAPVPTPTSGQGPLPYTTQQLMANGYSAEEIADFRAKGLVQ